MNPQNWILWQKGLVIADFDHFSSENGDIGTSATNGRFPLVSAIPQVEKLPEFGLSF